LAHSLPQTLPQTLPQRLAQTLAESLPQTGNQKSAPAGSDEARLTNARR
jgi:hypothetical protein